MFGPTCLRVVAPCAILTMTVALTAPATAAEPPTPAAVAPPTAEQTAPNDPTAWRRVAFPASLVIAGLGLVGGVGFYVRQNDRQAAFNELEVQDPSGAQRCATGKPQNGGPQCSAYLDQANSAARWSKISFGVAGAFALTALMLALTEPASPASSSKDARIISRLTCAPGLGASASCGFTF